MVKNLEPDDFIDNSGKPINRGQNNRPHDSDAKYTPEEEAHYQSYIEEGRELISKFLPGDENKSARTEAYKKLPSKAKFIGEYRNQQSKKQTPDRQQIRSTFIQKITKTLIKSTDSGIKYILFICIVMSILALLFPPWIYTFQRPGMGKISKPAGFGFILSPPTPERLGPFYGISIDTTRLMIEFVIIISIAWLIAWLLPRVRLIKNSTVSIFIFIFIPSMLCGTILTTWGFRFYRANTGEQTTSVQKVEDVRTNPETSIPHTELSSFNPLKPPKNSETYLYTYYDRQGRLVINNLPPNYVQNQGLTLKHVGIGRVRLQTAPDAIKQEASK